MQNQPATPASQPQEAPTPPPQEAPKEKKPKKPKIPLTKKGKTWVIILSAASGLFLVAGGVFGYLYYKQARNYRSLQDSYNTLEQELNNLKSAELLSISELQDQVESLQTQNSSYQAQISTLESQVENLESDKSSLQSDLSTANGKLSTIRKYQDFLDYLNHVVGIVAAGGEMTSADYNTLMDKAEATGDSNLVDSVETYWSSEAFTWNAYASTVGIALAGIDSQL